MDLRTPRASGQGYQSRRDVCDPRHSSGRGNLGGGDLSRDQPERVADALTRLYLTGAVEAGGLVAQHPRARGTGPRCVFVLHHEDESDGVGPASSYAKRGVRVLQPAKGGLCTSAGV
jgi:hypothetical protein